MIRLAFATILLACSALGHTAGFDYKLAANEVRPGVFVVSGVNDDLTFENGGNILNTGFIVTGDGVVVIDAGPSRLYGEQLVALIGQATDEPIVRVYITHHHPDHFFGLQAFDGVEHAALPQTINDLRLLAEGYSDNMYRLIGNAMLGTEIVLPTLAASAGTLEIGSRKLELLALSGHTESDLAIFDTTSGVLFAGDLVFHARAATTPHADIEGWQASLKTLDSLGFEVLVPGHGPVSENNAPIVETASYLDWLSGTLASAADAGLSPAEVMFIPVDARFRNLAVVTNEFQRSVVHLYQALEAALLPATETQ